MKSLKGIKATDLAFVQVDFEFPKKVRFPTLPVRTANGLIFPRKGTSYCGAPEVALANRLGAKLKLNMGVSVQHDLEDPIFKEFIVGCVEARTEHEKGSFGNLFWKDVGNSTYGKIAQGIRDKRVYDLKSDDMKALPASELTQPFFASFITSYIRAVLGEIMNSFPKNVSVFSVTTDGFLSNASDEDIEKAKALPLLASFIRARQALDPDSEPLEVKHHIRQPLGWRTRGSATLKPGTGGANDVVLQKGGINTDPLFDEERQNKFIIELFLNRVPGQKIPSNYGISVRDMITFDVDFVTLVGERRLSMEFDWKRRPKDAVDRDVTFEGRSYKHLSFETEPLEDVEEFERLRNAWTTYATKTSPVLKTTSDLQSSMTFVTTNKMGTASWQKYIRRKEGALLRVRRDLTRAFKNRCAGLQHCRMNNREFGEALVASGISCRIEDVENGKRYKFVPNQSIRTPEAEIAVGQFRTKFAPELREEDLWAIE